MVIVFDVKENAKTVYILLDDGFQGLETTSKYVDRLGLQRIRTRVRMYLVLPNILPTQAEIRCFYHHRSFKIHHTHPNR